MRMEMKKQSYRLAALLMCAAMVLSGCGAKDAPAPQTTLPPAAAPLMVPESDSMQMAALPVLFYLPSADGQRLTAVPGTAELSVSRHGAEKMCQMLFDHPGTENALPLSDYVSLSATEPVEVSRNVATVSLSASALRLSHEELFMVCQSITNTLCQYGDIRYVNVLISGVQPGVDVAATLPAGCFQPNTRDDLNVLWSRANARKDAGRATITAALYYPAAGAKGVLCEARPLSFTDMSAPGMVSTLLEALHVGPETMEGLPSYPDFFAYMTKAPQVNEVNGSRRVVLYFDASFNGAIIENGITRSVMVASLVYTIVTFLPGVDGVEMHIGDETILSLTPSATYVGAGETISFEDGLMERNDFLPFLLSTCTLYFADDNGMLCKVERAVPYYESRSARAVVNQLARGNIGYDSREGLKPVLPDALRDADLIGIAFAEDTLILNFSEHFVSLCQGMDGEQEKRLVYALVNSLCHLQGVKKVQILVSGTQPDTLAGSIYLPGAFLPNEDLVAP